MKTEIDLEKTFGKTYNILKGKEERLNCIKVEEPYLSMREGFCFRDALGITRIPMEHIGLATLAYNAAISTFHTTKISNNGQTSQVFEKLPIGAHIADFLDNFSPDVLAWYVDKNGEALSFVHNNLNVVYKPDLNNYIKSLDATSDPANEARGDFRREAIAQAMDQAITDYRSELRAGSDYDAHYNEWDTARAEWAVFNQKLNDLYLKAQHEFNPQEDQSQNNVDPQDQEIAEEQ